MLARIIIQRGEIDSVSKRDYFRVRVEQARMKSVLGTTGIICLREDRLLVHHCEGRERRAYGPRGGCSL